MLGMDQFSNVNIHKHKYDIVLMAIYVDDLMLLGDTAEYIE